jgi:hypothetical protein
MSRKYRRSLAVELVTAIETALSTGFEPGEFENAAAEVSYLLNEAEAPVSPAAVVQVTEKAIGLGLSELQFKAACVAVAREWHAQTGPVELPPDAHLEMAYEDRVSGPIDA